MWNNWISEYHFTAYSAVFLAATLISYFVAFLAWQRLSVKSARELARLMIAAGIWTFWIIFETAAVTMQDKILWSKLCYIGAVAAPVFYFIFVLRFTGRDKYASWKYILLLLIIPAVTFVLAATNENHLLVWSGYSAISPKNNIMEYYHGIWYWIGFVVYDYILLLLSTIYLFIFIARQKKAFRSQGVIVFLASLCPWTASVIYITGFNPVPGLDITPLSMVLSGTLLVFAILKTRFLDLVPVARETLFETLPDGILALDGQNRIQDINEAAMTYLGTVNKNLIGVSAESSGATDTVLLNAVIDEGSSDQMEIKTCSENKIFRIVKKKIKNYTDSRLIVIHDITGFKRVEEALRESEEKHRQLIENSHDIIYMLTPEGVFTFVSPAWTTLLGHPVSQVVNKSFVPFVHPDDIPECMKWLQKIIETGMRQEGIEYRVQHLNGTWFWHTSSAVPLRDESGAVIGFEGTARDITERKQAQKLLEQTRENYETFFNTIDDFLFVLDENGNIIHVNSTVISRLGYAAEELSGKSVLMVHPQERREEAGRIISEMLVGKADFCPVPVISKSGVQIPVETRISHGFWDGKPVIFGVTKDISQVRLSEEKFSKLFHLNPSACGLSDLEEQKYIEVNEAFYNLLGFNRDEVIGRTAIDLGILTDETRNSILLKADLNGNVMNAEVELKAKNGEIKNVLLSAENIFVQDKKFRFTVVNDITERKLAEQALQMEQKLLVRAQRELEDTNSKLKELNLQLEKLSIIDELSGLYNRRYFDNSLMQELSRHKRIRKPISLIMCDIDFFKNYNDILGHQAGDRCIQLVAGVLKKGATRPTDTVARYGGEEFVVILPQTDEPGCKKVAELIQDEIHNLSIPHPDSAVGKIITLSIGITTIIPDNSIRPEDIIDLADKALYDSKSSGRDRISSRLSENKP